MAKLSVFVSSTYYDLRHVRSSLELFIESMGYEAILSEKGNIAYLPEAPLDESCYREASTADIFVLIIGGRYGSPASGQIPTREVLDRYDSITKREYITAAEHDIPIYVLIEKSVYAEYQTFIHNTENIAVKYAHVDSVNVFFLIQEILSKRRNNPFHTFEKVSEIDEWLRVQWSGIFREFIQRSAGRKALTQLSTEVDDLKEINKTLKLYLEKVLSKISPEDASHFISSEDQRRELEKAKRIIGENEFVIHLIKRYKLSASAIYEALIGTDSIEDFVMRLSDLSPNKMLKEQLFALFTEIPSALLDFNEVRKALGLPHVEPQTPFDLPKISSSSESTSPK